jgi:hypothetical protein
MLSVLLSVGDGNARHRCRRLPAGGLGRRTMNWLSVNDLISWSVRQKVGVVGQIGEPDKREVGSSTLPRPIVRKTAGWTTSKAFTGLFGKAPGIGQVVHAGRCGEVDLFLGWCKGEQRFKEVPM